MEPSASGVRPQKAPEAAKRTPTVNKACVPCRARKVKCDAAVVGLPCSRCRSQQCAEDCVPLVRKGRSRKGMHALPTSRQTTASPVTSNRRQPENHSEVQHTSDGPVDQSPGQTEPDLLYLRILNDAVEENPGSSRLHTTSTTPGRQHLEESLTPRNCLSTRLSKLDEIDREYLAKKGVFDLPHPPYLDVFVKAYFDHVHPFCPVLSRADFVRRYRSGDCSLLLLYVVLTTASLHAPADALSTCGFASRSAAQESFFSRSRLLYDFAAEDDLLSMLQASIVLTLVILDRPTDRDFGYWFHNAISLATKLNLRNIILDTTKPREVLKPYRRAWWALYSLDNFHVFVNTRHSRLLENTLDIQPRTEDDWEDEDVSGDLSYLLSPVTPQQKASPVVIYELARISGECLSTVKTQQQQDPRQTMRSLDTWRKSLASKMNIDDNPETSVYYLNAKAWSYRFECILCRLIRRTWQRFERVDWVEWAKQRLRSAILELDTITMRVLASGTIEEFPTPFITTITALLALHIEFALDPNETNLIRSMSRISISQTILILNQGREVPVLKRALPIFEEILTKNDLHLVPPDSLSQSNHLVSAQAPSQENDTEDAYTLPHMQPREVWPQLEEWENNPSLDIDFLGFDFLDQWQHFGPLELSGSFGHNVPQ